MPVTTRSGTTYDLTAGGKTLTVGELLELEDQLTRGMLIRAKTPGGRELLELRDQLTLGLLIRYKTLRAGEQLELHFNSR